MHETFSERKIVSLKFNNPDTLIIAHPEYEEAVLKNADYIGSTNGLLDFVTKSDKKNSLLQPNRALFIRCS